MPPKGPSQSAIPTRRRKLQLDERTPTFGYILRFRRWRHTSLFFRILQFTMPGVRWSTEAEYTWLLTQVHEYHVKRSAGTKCKKNTDVISHLNGLVESFKEQFPGSIDAMKFAKSDELTEDERLDKFRNVSAILHCQIFNLKRCLAFAVVVGQ